MQYLKDRAFVIKRVNFGDSDRFLTLFSQNHGKIEVVAKGVRKITSRRASSIELVNLIDFQAVRSARNHILTEVKLVDSFSRLKCDLNHMKKVFLTCELIDVLLPSMQKHEDIFDLLTRALSSMSDSEKNILYFQAKLVSMLGFWDSSEPFKNGDHIREHIESIIERKLKTRVSFEI